MKPATMQRVAEGVIGFGFALVVTALAMLASPVIALVMWINDRKRAAR